MAYFSDLLYTQGLYIALPLALIGVLSWRRLSFTTTSDSPATEASQHTPPSSSTLITETAVLKKKEKNGAHSKNNGKHVKNGTENDFGAKSDVDSADGSAARMLSIWDCVLSPKCSTSESDCGVLISEANWTPIVLFLTQCFYFLVFHNLANLPLGDRLLFGVHQRFWMQPNVLTFMWAGIGFNEVVRLISHLPDSAAMLRAFRPRSYDEYVGRKPSSSMLSIVCLALAAGLVALQCYRWYFLSDQKDALHFRSYARAILDPLPKNAVLLINYDMQWTSLRYVTQCEGYRSDVTLINLSMMTYTWFIHKRSLYPKLKFPGVYLASPASSAVVTGTPEGKAFTLTRFLDANIAKGIPIFLGGKVPHSDPELNERYENVPTGLVSRFVPISSAPNGTIYRSYVHASWQHVLQNLRQLPNTQKYPEETWEWTIGRDFKDRVIDTSSFYLQAAISVASQDPAPLINAAYWLESCVVLESLEGGTIPAHVLKNAGLAHLHLVQNNQLKEGAPLLVDGDIFGLIETVDWPTSEKIANGMDWRKWSAERFLHYWGNFLQRPEAASDKQYDTIKSMYETVSAAESKGKTATASKNSHSDKEKLHINTGSKTDPEERSKKSPKSGSKKKVKKPSATEDL